MAGHGRKREVMHDLPHGAHLRHLRRQARELQRRTGEPLHAAQFGLARSYGFASWSELKHTLETGQLVLAWTRRPLGKREFEAKRDAALTPTAAELLPALRHPNPRVRFECLGLLDHLADEDSVEAMIAATRDPVPRIRRMAVHALGCVRCKASTSCRELVPGFLPIAEGDPVWRVRREAVIAIAQQPADDRSRAVLARLAEADPHPDVRKQATWALRVQMGLSWAYGRRER
jgi:HEAT repeats